MAESTLQDLDGGPDLENNANTDAEGSESPEWFPYPTRMVGPFLDAGYRITDSKFLDVPS
jgi:hypothetical protein